MRTMLGYNHILKIWCISENEINLIPNLKRELLMFLKMISIILLIQLSSFILVFSHLNLLYSIGLPVIPPVLFLTYFLFLYFFNDNKIRQLFIAFLLLSISLINGVTFLIYYFKEEMELVSFAQQTKDDLLSNFKFLYKLVFSEFYYQIFAAIILLFFITMYSIPFFIVRDKSHKLLIQIKKINEQLRKKK
jgi:hypothetical protein